MREGDEAREAARKEMIDQKRQLRDSNRERDVVQATANELRGLLMNSSLCCVLHFENTFLLCLHKLVPRQVLFFLSKGKEN